MQASRLQQSIGKACLVAALVIAATAFSGRAEYGRNPVVTVGSIASQLGVSVVIGVNEEFELGMQFTGTLEAPEKLDLLGIAGMHPGARVYAARISRDRVHVEADELSPPRRVTAKLRLDENGKLLAAPKTIASIGR